jgi:hypothetical protein
MAWIPTDSPAEYFLELREWRLAPHPDRPAPLSAFRRERAWSRDLRPPLSNEKGTPTRR